jgi:hypothetical protein
MITGSWGSTALGASPVNGSELSFAAMRGGGGGGGGGPASAPLMLRLVNHVARPQTVTVRFVAKGAGAGPVRRAAGGTARVLTLRDSMAGAAGDTGDNSPAAPTRISPVISTIPVSGDGKGTVVVELPPYSFVNVEL